VFVRHWESADVRKKTALVIVLKAKLNRSWRFCTEQIRCAPGGE
jgi:hypothetical protein